MSESTPSVLSQPEYDLSKACSCDECGSKIEKLKEFEKEIEAKTELITKYADRLQEAEYICMNISSCSWWTKEMLDILHRKLKAVSKKLGVPFTLTKSRSAENLRIIDREIVELRNWAKSVPDDDYDVDNDDDEDTSDVLEEIDTGRFYYKHTKAKDAAYLLLDRIEEIEKDHVKAKENAVEPSISKDYIERQIQLVKKLPVEELKLELKELREVIQPRDKNWMMFHDARKFISKKFHAVLSKINEFWEGSPKGNGHISNGVNVTLDSLIVEVTSFEDECKKEYATVFTLDRADPKRQRTRK